MGNIEALRHNVRKQLGTQAGQCTAPDRFEGKKAVVSQLTGAFARAVLVIVMITMPSILLPGIGPDSAQVVTLLALFGAALTFAEYASTYPGLIEFRDAPPFNRVRFLSLFITLLLVSLICRGQTEPTVLTLFTDAIGSVVGQAMNFPYSPVNLMVQVMPAGTDLETLELVRNAAGISYLISLLTLAAFLMLLKVNQWPSRSGPFNVWVNLPTFDPSIGGDVVARLVRDARINIILGFLLPFIIPAAIKSAATLFDPISLESSQTLVWTMALWAFLPASLFMRGIAMGRIASMVKDKRRRTYAYAERNGLLPA